jgi:hypothetical protein
MSRVQEVLDAVADFSLHDLSDQFAPESQPVRRPPPMQDVLAVERELFPEVKTRAAPKLADVEHERASYDRTVLRELNGNSRSRNVLCCLVPRLPVCQLNAS